MTESIAADEAAGRGKRLRSIDPRLAIFLLLGTVLVVLAATGTFTVGSGVDLTVDEAIEIARPEIDFVPVNEGARLVRQGAGLQPVWAVSFSIPGEGGRDDFERLTTVEIHANSGQVLRVSRSD